jgi:uncharacterized membrane protein
MGRDAWLALHILGVVIFLGNIIVTGAWKVLADQTRDATVIAFAQRLVTITDVAFTATGAALIATAGAVLANDFGGISGPSWITWGASLFFTSGAIWIAVLLPIQVRQARQARLFAVDRVIPSSYWRLARLWYVFGTVATLLPLASLYFMVFKPQ